MSWNDQTVVDAYSAEDASKSWYEERINIPSIMSLLPGKRVKVLDFGCGPGDFTSQLAKHFDVVGADNSELMLRKAREKYKNLTFVAWDGLTDLPKSYQPFDTIVTKLTLEFIEDLSSLAKCLFDSLVPKGSLVISVQHPLLAIAMHPEKKIPYWGTPKFDVQIGTTGTTVTKIHRNLNDYIEPFISCGFKLEKIIEPQISDDVANTYNAREIDLKFPKRLNIRFRKP